MCNICMYGSYPLYTQLVPGKGKQEPRLLRGPARCPSGEDQPAAGLWGCRAETCLEGGFGALDLEQQLRQPGVRVPGGREPHPQAASEGPGVPAPRPSGSEVRGQVLPFALSFSRKAWTAAQAPLGPRCQQAQDPPKAAGPAPQAQKGTGPSCPLRGKACISSGSSAAVR